MSKKHVRLFCVIAIILGQTFGHDQTPYGDVLKYVNNIDESSVGETCSKQMQLYLDALKEMKPWALKLADATSKLQPGILTFNLFELGNFDECLSVEEKVEDEDILGKYCLGSIPLPSFLIPGGGGGGGENNETEETLSTLDTMKNFKNARMGITGGFDFLSLKWSICIPNGCSAEKIQTILSSYIADIKFNEGACQSKSTKPELNTVGIVTIALFGTIIFVMFISTLYEIYTYLTNKESAHLILTAFSMFTNGKKLFATSNNSNQLLCIHGLKAVSMMWVLICHGYMSAAVTAPISNILDVLEWKNSQSSMFIMGGSFAVDTFFVVGGLLTVYTYLGAVDNGIRFNIFTYYIHRYIRLTPVLAAAVLVHVGLMLHFGSGPFFPSITQAILVKDCEKNWWKALLYFQNYANGKDVCVPQSWYLSVDMQLFLLSPLYLLPLKKYTKIVMVALGVTSLASMAAGFAVAWHYELKGDLPAQTSNEESEEFFIHYYYPMHTRMAPYLFGVILGYFVYQRKKGYSKFTITKSNAFVLWLCALSILIVCVFGNNNMMKVGHEYNKWEHSLFIALARPAWAVGICWIILACCLGYGGPINWFLSLSPLQVISKLAYSMYIVHYSILFMRYATFRVIFRFSDLQMMYNFWGDFWFSTAVSIAWTLMFESPMITIEKVIFGKGKKSTRKHKENNT